MLKEDVAALGLGLLVAMAPLVGGCGSQVICEGGACGGGSGATGPGATGSTGTGTTTGGSTDVDFTDYCEQLCSCGPNVCEGGVDGCLAEAAELTEEALAAGCGQELAAVETCLEQFTCGQGFPSTPACLDATADALSVCIGDEPPPPVGVCAQATAICGGEPGPGPCTGVARCFAECVVDLGSCAVEPGSELEACLDDCM